jgi:hypothetical protein
VSAEPAAEIAKMSQKLRLQACELLRLDAAKLSAASNGHLDRGPRKQVMCSKKCLEGAVNRVHKYV